MGKSSDIIFPMLPKHYHGSGGFLFTTEAKAYCYKQWLLVICQDKCLNRGVTAFTLHVSQWYFWAWQISSSWRIDMLFTLNVMHDVDVAFLMLLPRSSFICGKKWKLCYAQVPTSCLAMSILSKLFGYSHRYNSGKDENCFAHEKLILVVKYM